MKSAGAVHVGYPTSHKENVILRMISEMFSYFSKTKAESQFSPPKRTSFI